MNRQEILDRITAHGERIANGERVPVLPPPQHIQHAGNIKLALRIELEIKIVSQLIEAALIDPNNTIQTSCDEGETWTLPNRKKDKILKAMFETDEELVRIVNSFTNTGIQFELIYGNEGFDVIHDYTDNDAAKSIYLAAMKGISE